MKAITFSLFSPTHGRGPGDKFRFLTHEETDDLVSLMIGYYISNTNFRLILDVVKEHRAHEDYDARQSSVKTDFYRSWYHSRSQIKMVDMVQAEGAGHYPYDVIDSRMDVARFTERLDKKNQHIVRLLLDGYTQAEIAKKLGFSNHNGVNKRIKKIGEQFIAYLKP